MCKEVEKVLQDNAVNQVACTVLMDGEAHASNDFVCVMTCEDSVASLFYNTDALTLGMAMKMVTRAFVEAMHQLPEDDQEDVAEILGWTDLVKKDGDNE